MQRPCLIVLLLSYGSFWNLSHCWCEDAPVAKKLSRKLARYYELCRENPQKIFSIEDKTFLLETYWMLLTSESKSRGQYGEIEYNRQKLIGFMNSQGIQPPLWWEAAVLNSAVLTQKDEITKDFQKPDQEWEFLKESYALREKGQASGRFYGNMPLLSDMELVDNGKDPPFIKIGDERMIRELNSLPKENKNLIPLLFLTNSHTYLLLRQVWTEFDNTELFAFELQGKLAWSSKLIEQPRRIGGATGMAFPTQTVIRANESDLFVYRYDVHGEGLEGFDLKTGERKFLFIPGLAEEAFDHIRNRKAASELKIAKGIYLRGDPESVKQAIEQFKRIMYQYSGSTAGEAASFIIENYQKLSPTKKHITLKELLK